MHFLSDLPPGFSIIIYLCVLFFLSTDGLDVIYWVEEVMTCISEHQQYPSLWCPSVAKSMWPSHFLITLWTFTHISETVSSVYHLQSDANLADTGTTFSQHPLITTDICTTLAELWWHEWMKVTLNLCCFFPSITHIFSDWNSHTLSYYILN